MEENKIENELKNNWILLFSASIGVICSSIVLPFYSLGALVVPITQEFGWSRAEFQLALLFSTGAGVVTAPLVGIFLDKVGIRKMALLGPIPWGGGGGEEGRRTEREERDEGGRRGQGALCIRILGSFSLPR